MVVMGQGSSFHINGIEVVISGSIRRICIWNWFWNSWLSLLVVVVKWDLGILGHEVVGRYLDEWVQVGLYWLGDCLARLFG